MIRTSTAEPFTWTVPWALPDKPRRYFFRAGSVAERASLEGDLVGEYRAGEVYDFQLGAAFAEGVTALSSDNPEDAARLIEIEQQVRAGEEVDAQDGALLDKARELLVEHWPGYRRLTVQAARRAQFLPLLAFQRFCVGWDADDLPAFERGMDGQVLPALLTAIPPLEIRSGGVVAYRLLYGVPPASGDGKAAEEPEKTAKNS